jgi:formate hydrogenlyase subunit 3/multisubunit Na+/H+ antiporter MnhD subunit
MREQILLAPILLPLCAGILILIIPRSGRWTGPVLGLLASAAAFVASLMVFLQGAPPVDLALFTLGRFSLGVHLSLRPLASFMLLFGSGFVFLACLYSVSYFKGAAGRPRYGEYYAFILMALGGACAVLVADHMLILLIGWEVVTASLYFLITTGSSESRAGATKTFATLGAADGCLLAGIGTLWLLTDSMRISQIQLEVTGWLSGAAFVLMLIGAVAKAGSIPFHSWIPAASDHAPASVMALLPAALDKLLGIYLLVRLVMPGSGIFVITPALSLMLMILGAVTIVVAVMIAMVQHDLRRLLSYHAISLVGYMVLGIGTLSPIGIAGGLFHMLNNTIYKNCLFLCAGSVENRTGTTDLARLGGLARAMPATFLGCLISALAISGVPPLNGFASKWLVYQGVIETGMQGSFVFLVAAMFGSALTLASFVKVIYSVFLGPPTESTRHVRTDSRVTMTAPIVVLALLSVAFGVYLPLPLRAFIGPAVGAAVVPAGLWSAGTATSFIVLGILVGLLIYLFGKIGSSARTVSSYIGGEDAVGELDRVAGTGFYETIRRVSALKGPYAAQEAGKLDPFRWLGGVGHVITAGLQAIHNGLLSWYLAWSLVGVGVLILVFLM